jgi:hypothetical protein
VLVLSVQVSGTGTTQPAPALSGQVGGTWTSPPADPQWPPIADGGYTETLTGGGTVQPLGPVQVTGTLNFPGNTTGGSTGMLTLSNANGRVTLQFVGPRLLGLPSGSPVTFAYAIWVSEGAYEGVSGTGTFALSGQADNPNAGSFTLTFS